MLCNIAEYVCCAGTWRVEQEISRKMLKDDSAMPSVGKISKMPYWEDRDGTNIFLLIIIICEWWISILKKEHGFLINLEPIFIGVMDIFMLYNMLWSLRFNMHRLLKVITSKWSATSTYFNTRLHALGILASYGKKIIFVPIQSRIISIYFNLE